MKMMKVIGSCLFLFLLGGVGGTARGQQEFSFRPPLDLPLLFSGNFGEIRADHFHGGLDFKTGGRTGEKVHALADGYVSRIRVTHGSGYVLDVVYDNGYATVNRHLSAFVGEMARRVEALQYERESWEVEIVPRPDEYSVHRGDVIALSGNTGYSFGPHLHLDVMELSTGESVDPLPFFKDQVADHTPPRAQSFMLFPCPGKGAVDGQAECKAFSPRAADVPTAWGWIGAGICAYDYMEGTHNRYGVKYVTLEVDGELVFESTVDRFSDDENLYINSWTHGQYMKSFIEPGNRLRMLRAPGRHGGLVLVDEERPYCFEYTLADALGNTTRVGFTLQGRQTPIPPANPRGWQKLCWDGVNLVSRPGLQVVIPRGRLYKDEYVDYRVEADSGDVAFTYRLQGPSVSLHRPCLVSIGLRHRPVADSTKYYVASFNSRGKPYSLGGSYRDGAMQVRTRTLGSYTVRVDTVPPQLAAVQPRLWGRQGRIVIQAKDRETGIARYRGTIDGQYVLFGRPNSIDGHLVCRLDPKHVRKGRHHVLLLEVTDECGNTAVRRFEFDW